MIKKESDRYLMGFGFISQNSMLTSTVTDWKNKYQKWISTYNMEARSQVIGIRLIRRDILNFS